MAELIGIVASGISIVQLTGQIAQSLVKLKSYWDHMKDAPDEVKYLMRDIELLRLILSDFEQERLQSHLPDIAFNNHIFDQSLAFCKEAAIELSELAEAMDTQLSSTSGFYRKRAAFNLLLKQGHIKRCKPRAILRLQFESMSARLPIMHGSMRDSAGAEDIPSASVPTAENKVHDESMQLTGNSNAILKATLDSSINFESATSLFGRVSISKQRRGKSQPYQSKLMAQYRVPTWLGYKAWEFYSYRAHMGWNFYLSIYNVIPSNSRQLQYAKFGCLSKLQRMISNKEASVFDQTEQGNSILSIAALGGQVEVCRWLLQQGARTEHMRFGSILNQVLYYGGSMSFQEGISTLEIVQVLQNKEERDIIDNYGDTEEACLYYGRKEVLFWLLEQSNSLGYQHTPEDKAQLAINIARNTQHNGPDLVRTVLKGIDPELVLQVRNTNGVALLHRIASRIGGAFAYEAQGMYKSTKFFDAGFNISADPAQRGSITRSGWRSFLRELDLTKANMHAITECEVAAATPMVMGIRTLIFTWVGSTSRLITALSKFFLEWLSDLESLGVNLLSYGEEEKRLQTHNFVSTNFWRRKQGGSAKYRRENAKASDERCGILRLVNFQPDTCAEKWQFWWSEPTDEFSGEFWRMSEREPLTTPGAWEEDLFEAI